jgi:phosphoglycerate dehydrogenase-like enzyme
MIARADCQLIDVNEANCKAILVMNAVGLNTSAAKLTCAMILSLAKN